MKLSELPLEEDRLLLVLKDDSSLYVCKISVYEVFFVNKDNPSDYIMLNEYDENMKLKEGLFSNSSFPVDLDRFAIQKVYLLPEKGAEVQEDYKIWESV